MRDLRLRRSTAAASSRKCSRSFRRPRRYSSSAINGSAIAAGIGYMFRDTIEMPWASSLKASRPLCANVAALLARDASRDQPSDGRSSISAARRRETDRFSSSGSGAPSRRRSAWEYRLFKGEQMPDQSPSNVRSSERRSRCGSACPCPWPRGSVRRSSDRFHEVAVLDRPAPRLGTVTDHTHSDHRRRPGIHVRRRRRTRANGGAGHDAGCRFHAVCHRSASDFRRQWRPERPPTRR